MDTLLVSGDHFTDSRRLPVAVTGERELIQRALLRLSIKKGSFKEDPSLGSELYKLKGFHGENLERLAQSYAQEALLPMPEISVSSVALERAEPDKLRLYINILNVNKSYRLEVDIV